MALKLNVTSFEQLGINRISLLGMVQSFLDMVSPKQIAEIFSSGKLWHVAGMASFSKNNGERVKFALSCPTVCDPMDCSWTSPGQNTEVGTFSLLQGIFSTQGSNPGLLHYRRILYHLSHQGSP